MALSTVLRALVSLTVLPLLAAICYLVGLSVYYYFFHPYAKYPGPLLAKISPVYSLWYAYIGDLHIDVLRCHEKYGKYYHRGSIIKISTLRTKQVLSSDMPPIVW